QSIPQIFLSNGYNLGVFEFWQRRKFLLWQSKNFEEALAASNRRRVFPIHVDLDFGGRQFPHDIEQATRWKGGGTFLLNLRLETSANPNVEISRGEMNFVSLGLKQDVGEDGQCRPGANDVLNLLE